MHDPIIFARSQETSIRFSCIQLLRHGCASNVMKAGRQAFQKTSVHIIFIECCDKHLVKKSLHSSTCQNLLMCFSRTEEPFSKDVSLRGTMLNAVDLGSFPSQKGMS